MADDAEVLEALRPIVDPEIGISIVDLGLVYRAARSDHIDVAITLTTRACPLGEMILEQVRSALEFRFPEVRDIRVALVWDPPWTPAMMSPEAQRQLG
jgi:metal-sulfur cluster biosynthetic enzyme